MIREMKSSDYFEVYRLWDEAQEVGINEKDDTYEKIEVFIERNPGLCMVAVEDGSIVGSLLAGFDGRRGHIYHTIVKSEYRSRGIGNQLVNKVMQKFEKLGVSEVDLLAMSDNFNGNQFWEKRGFMKKSNLNYRRKVIE